MTTQKKRNLLIVLIILLLLTTLGLAFYSVHKTNEYNNLQEVFEQEKNDLEEGLDEVIKDYTDVVLRKKNISKRLQGELVKMNALRDSIKNLRIDNYKLIRIYRKKINSLERENKKLFIRVDSLNVVNHTLLEENVIKDKILEQKETINVSLANQNKVLEQKIAIAGVVKTGPITAIAMKERSSGRLTSTSRSSRTDAFRVNFTLLKNLLADAEEKLVYIQIRDEDNRVVASKGTTKLKNGAKIEYSDTVEVNYNNEKLNLVSLILVNRDDIGKGEYTVSTFVDGVYSAFTTLKLR